MHQTKMQLATAKQPHRHSYNQIKSSHGPAVGLSGHSVSFIKIAQKLKSLQFPWNIAATNIQLEKAQEEKKN